MNYSFKFLSLKASQQVVFQPCVHLCNPVQINWVDELFDTKTRSGNKVSKPFS